MSNLNYYGILGLSSGAGFDEIKRAYRAMARTLHPDVNPGDALAGARFKRVVEAYNVLIDPVARRRYDYRRRGYSVHNLVVDSPEGEDMMQAALGKTIRGTDHYRALFVEDNVFENGGVVSVSLGEGVESTVLIPENEASERCVLFKGYGNIGENGEKRGDLHFVVMKECE